MGIARDSQRSKVYTAEAPFYRGSADLRVLDVFAQEVQDSALFRSLCLEFSPDFARRRARVTHSKGGATRPLAVYNAKEVRLPRWCRSEHTVLHELTHFAVRPRSEVAPHGPEFCNALLQLSGEFIGPDRRLQLGRLFDKCRVTYVPRRRA